MSQTTVIRIAGVAVGTVVMFHFWGMPWGLIGGCSLAMLFLG